MARVPSGIRRHRVSLQNPDGPAVPDGDGGYTQPMKALDPPDLIVAIESSGGQDERLAPGTVASSATRIISGPWHPQVTTQTVITYDGRTFNVVGVRNDDERGRDMVLTCEERTV